MFGTYLLIVVFGTATTGVDTTFRQEFSTQHECTQFLHVSFLQNAKLKKQILSSSCTKLASRPQ